jgi:hypothetical protein
MSHLRAFFMAGLTVAASAPPVTEDADAAAYLNAIGINAATAYYPGTAFAISGADMRAAVSQFVSQLKAAGIWAKLRVVYPLVGGTASSHRLNLKDPRDLDAAFRLTFYGSPSHGPAGIAWNGASQYADTYFVPSVHGEADGTGGLSAYVRDATNAGDTYDMGAYTGTPGSFLTASSYDNGPYARVNGNTVGPNLPAGAAGMHSVEVPTATAKHLYRNGAALFTTNSAVGFTNAPASVSVFLGAMNVNGNPYGFTPRAGSLYCVEDGLTAAETETYQALSAALQTALHRNV